MLICAVHREEMPENHCVSCRWEKFKQGICAICTEQVGFVGAMYCKQCIKAVAVLK